MPPRRPCGRVPNLASSLDGMAVSPWATEKQLGALVRLPCRRMATKPPALGQAVKPVMHRMHPRGLDDPVGPERRRRTMGEVQAGMPQQVKRLGQHGVPHGQQCDA